jgi:hypothetical protein
MELVFISYLTIGDFQLCLCMFRLYQSSDKWMYVTSLTMQVEMLPKNAMQPLSSFDIYRARNKLSMQNLF